MSKYINLECPGCGATMRNHRSDYDPPEATLLLVRCPQCAVGCKEDGGTYFNKRGEEVSYREPAGEGERGE